MVIAFFRCMLYQPSVEAIPVIYEALFATVKEVKNPMNLIECF